MTGGYVCAKVCTAIFHRQHCSRTYEVTSHKQVIISWKRYKIEIKFQWKTNRKWHASYQIALISMTLSDLESHFSSRHPRADISNKYSTYRNFASLVTYAKVACRNASRDLWACTAWWHWDIWVNILPMVAFDNVAARIWTRYLLVTSAAY